MLHGYYPNPAEVHDRVFDIFQSTDALSHEGLTVMVNGIDLECFTFPYTHTTSLWYDRSASDYYHLDYGGYLPHNIIFTPRDISLELPVSMPLDVPAGLAGLITPFQRH